jgi:two-component system OmpR family response regulator
MQNPPHILVVDDDLEIRKLLGRYLSEQGFRISIASDQKTMKDALLNHEFDLIVLDVLLPDGSGLDICRNMRRDGATVPIILLTALKEDVDRIIGLEIGADDYLGKPFNPRELVARIRAVLRRKVAQDIEYSRISEYRFLDFKLQPIGHSLKDGQGAAIDLTTAEFDLLLALVRRPGRLLSRDLLIEATARRPSDVFDRSVDVLMSRLRKKLGDNETNQIIRTVRNGGYLFCPNVEIVEISGE